jgi:uncharacterized membrane protein YedE/YeeE
MKQWPALLTGLIFGMGLALSGMTDTAKVQGFLDITGAWVPDLMFVMGGALIVTLGATPLVLSRAKPLFADMFSLPANKAIDGRLIGGGVLFGIGWGLWGYCPGPAIAALAYGYESTLIFCVAMIAGMWVAGVLGLVKSRVDG